MIAAAAETDRLVAVGDAAALARIVDPANQLAIWRRPPPPALAWIETLDWDAVDHLDFPAAVDALGAEIADGLAQAGYPADARSDALTGEIGMLARCFAAVMGCSAVRLRLEVVETDACGRFHADLVPARLLATLHGPATQWIRAHAPDAVGQLGPGDVAIFKGRRPVEEPAILHRSPPIAGTGDVRLLLAIDPIAAGGPSDE